MIAFAAATERNRSCCCTLPLRFRRPRSHSCPPPAHPPSLPQGQWKLISRYYVPSRTPTQVASHAQKHFLRQSGAQKRRSRFSAVEEAAVSPQPPVPPLLPPLPLPGLHRAPGMMAAPPPATAPGVPAMPTLFGHSLPPAQHAAVFLQPPPRLVGAPGTVVGGVAMGVPIGVLPPLPSITTASELPGGQGWFGGEVHHVGWASPFYAHIPHVGAPLLGLLE